MIVISPQSAPLPLQHRAAVRPRSLDGLRIGLLDNTKAPVDQMLKYLSERLAERLKGVTFVNRAKKHPSMQADRDVIEGLARSSDVVINALGD